jgi:hypothetical protein
MMSIFFHPEADTELVAAANYYEGQQEDLVYDLFLTLKTVLPALESILSFIP